MLDGIYGDARRAANGLDIDFALGEKVRSDGVYVRARRQEFPIKDRLTRGRRRDNDRLIDDGLFRRIDWRDLDAEHRSHLSSKALAALAASDRLPERDAVAPPSEEVSDMTFQRAFAALAALCVPAVAPAAGDAARGAEVFRACAACHSFVAGEHRTGPSLAAVYGRRVGTAEGFQRYSEALRQSAVVWNEQ